jgi:hypothetical protein
MRKWAEHLHMIGGGRSEGKSGRGRWKKSGQLTICHPSVRRITHSRVFAVITPPPPPTNREGFACTVHSVKKKCTENVDGLGFVQRDFSVDRDVAID